MNRKIVSTGLMAVTALVSTLALAQTAEDRAVLEQSLAITPSGPWSAGDQLGMANTQGPGTWMRCAAHMGKPGAKSYELSHERSNDMPQSPFGAPLVY